MSWGVIVPIALLCLCFIIAAHQIRKAPTAWELNSRESQQWAEEVRDELAMLDLPGEVRIEPSAIYMSPERYVYVLFDEDLEFDGPHLIVSRDTEHNDDPNLIICGWYPGLGEPRHSFAHTRNDILDWVNHITEIEGIV